VYDVNGRRVEKSTSAGNTDFLYDTSGNVSGEWQVISGYTGPSVHYAYMNGQLIAEYTAGTTYFVHKDHLGSTRLVTRVDQSLADNMDYLPFGEQITGGSSTTHKFTTKERDAETASTSGGTDGLDNSQARFLGSRFGRFLSPDPENAGASLINPQSWNMYAYVANNPLILIDPDGLDCIYTNGNTVTNVRTGDCASDDDAGTFVDGTIRGGKNGVSLSNDGKVAVFTLDDESDPSGYRIASACVGNCPTIKIPVNAPFDPDIPAWTAPNPSIWQRFDQRHGFNRPSGANVAGCFAGMDPDLALPLPPFEPKAPKQAPADSTKEVTAQRRAQVLHEGSDKPAEYGNHRPISLNPQGNAHAESIEKITDGWGYIGGVNTCIQNASHH
jgi:RHS repeat-associated protein